MALNGDHPALRLAAQGVRIRTPEKQDQPRGRAVTDLILFHLCPRNAHFFSEGRYPSHTPPAVIGLIPAAGTAAALSRSTRATPAHALDIPYA